MSGTPGQATGRVICPVLASAGGRCVSGTLGSTKNFLFWRTRLWGCLRTTAQVARVDRTVSHVWYTGSVSPARLNKPRWYRGRHCLPISQAVGGGSHGQVVPACANPQTLRLIGVDGVFQSPLSSPINYCRPHPVWVGPVPDVTMLYDRAAGAEDKSVGCIITMPPWSSLQHLVPVTTAMGPAGGGRVSVTPGPWGRTG